MSCISVNIGEQKIGNVTAVVHHPHKVTVNAMTNTGWFDLNVFHTSPIVVAKKTGNMKLNVFLVCRVSSQEFLFVRPEDAMWITIDKSIDYEIRSNTEWNIN